jgi:hypothetical protein
MMATAREAGNRTWRSSSTSTVMGLPVITRHIEQNRIVRALLPSAYRMTSQRELP